MMEESSPPERSTAYRTSGVSLAATQRRISLRTSSTALSASSIIASCVVNFHGRSEEHTSELQSLMRISYAVFCLKKKKHTSKQRHKAQRTTKLSKHRHNII